MTMNKARPGNAKRTLFVRMLTAYIILIIVTSTAVGVSSLMIFERFHIRTVNENVRQSIADNHLNLVTQINGIRDDITGGIFMQQFGMVPQVLNTELGTDNYADIKGIYDYLNQEVLRNSNYVNGIHIYYRENNMLISSKYGLKLLDSHNGEGIELDWLELMFLNDVKNVWIHTREVAFTTSSESSSEFNYSFITTYPMTHSSKDAKIMICIDFDETMLSERLNSDGKSINYILDHKGHVISAPMEIQNNSFNEDYFAEDEGYYLEKIDGEDYLVSYIKEPENGWLLVNQYPTSGLYKTMVQIKRTILAIAALTTIIGIAVSFLMAQNFYHPVKDIMAMIKRYDKSGDDLKGGEFNRISTVINGLDGHVSQLQDTIDSSRGLLIAKLIGDLSRKRGLASEDIRERMNFLGINLSMSEYMFMKVEISYIDANELMPSQAQIIKYRLINEISQLSDGNSSLLATDYEDNSILVLINTELSAEAFKRTKIQDLTRIENIFSAEVFIRIFLMDAVQDIHHLYRSYRQLDSLKEMVFYLPTKQILTSEDIAKESSDAVIDIGLFSKFEQQLYGGHDGVFDEVDHILDEAVKQKYSTVEKQKAMMNLMSIIAKYIKDVSLTSHEIMDENIYGIFDEMEDVNMFRQWLTEVIGKVFALLNDTNDNALNDTISKVKAYIEENMSQDLSLGLVAGKVYLSPQYLSALFKREVGVNFSAYLLKLRMEKARTLLVETDKKVEEVCILVGYQTSHYFIKKFKEHTGLTPRQYRSRHTKL